MVPQRLSVPGDAEQDGAVQEPSEGQDPRGKQGTGLRLPLRGEAEREIDDEALPEPGCAVSGRPGAFPAVLALRVPEDR